MFVQSNPTARRATGDVNFSAPEFQPVALPEQKRQDEAPSEYAACATADREPSVPLTDAAPACSSLFRLDFGGIRGADPAGNPTNEIYFIGIIDFLTEYGLRKQAEHALKSLVSDGVRR